ncbi:MAG: hypothetical protein IKZ19_09075 [Clostridia bacterium]|nr:hypothetical protein [Clostridia bacterium]
MKTAKRYLPALVFLIFIIFVFAVNLIVPDRDFSEKENRQLAEAPQFTFKALTSGKFTADFETYITDQFFSRDTWVAMKAKCERLLGKNHINGVLIGKKGLLVSEFTAPDPTRLAANAQNVEIFAANADIPVYFTLVPGAIELWSDRLPNTGRTASQADIIANAYAATPSAIHVDSYAALSAHADEDIYYLTDHHWTTLGAYYGYRALVTEMGLEPVGLPAAFIETEGFFGTAASACGLAPGKGDTVILREPESVAASVRVYSDGQWKDSTLYKTENLEVRDKYTVFLGGNDPLTVVEGSAENGPVLLLMKDSYANCEIPYLCRNFSEIHVVDLRYYKESIAAYIENNGIDVAVVSYSVANFSEDTNIYFLTR